MDPTLGKLARGDRVWVICERHRIAQRGTVIEVGQILLTIELPCSSLSPQRYDRNTGMHVMDGYVQRWNGFFIKTELPTRYGSEAPDSAYVVIDETESHHAST